MPDISPVQPISTVVVPNRTEFEVPTQAVKPLQDADFGRTTNEYTFARPQAIVAFQEKPTPDHTISDNKLTGPPPAFQASLLEIESDLDYVIKRIEAAREKSHNDQAVSPEPNPKTDAILDLGDINAPTRVEPTPYDIEPERADT